MDDAVLADQPVRLEAGLLLGGRLLGDLSKLVDRLAELANLRGAGDRGPGREVPSLEAVEGVANLHQRAHDATTKSPEHRDAGDGDRHDVADHQDRADLTDQQGAIAGVVGPFRDQQRGPVVGVGHRTEEVCPRPAVDGGRVDARCDRVPRSAYPTRRTSARPPPAPRRSARARRRRPRPDRAAPRRGPIGLLRVEIRLQELGFHGEGVAANELSAPLISCSSRLCERSTGTHRSMMRLLASLTT